ncbi:hypothetical protein EV363DRAFT_220777 [Boletus edulis]|nr:hypothetical protein EV363DRAFT_220777 [Boletus edulis]
MVRCSGARGQRKIFTYVELYLPRLGYAKRANTIVPDLMGEETLELHDEHLPWAFNFRQLASKKLERLGDKVVDALRYDDRHCSNRLYTWWCMETSPTHDKLQTLCKITQYEWFN